MGRIRSIKPELPQSESMGSVCREARLLFILLWTVVDDEGRTRGAVRMLASLLYPYDEDQAKLPKLIEGWLEELASQNCLIRYKVDGNSYLEICNFTKHQKIDKSSKSKLPPPPPRDMSSNASDVSVTDKDLGGDQEKDQGVEEDLDHGALVERVFEHYRQKLHRDPKSYTLTRDRKARAVTRIRERLKIHNGDMQQVKRELATAIENLAGSEYHVSQGYVDWTEQIFRSAEEFEKRINWKKPEAVNASNQHSQGRKFDAAQHALQQALAGIDQEELHGGAGEDVLGPGGGDGSTSSGVILPRTH